MIIVVGLLSVIIMILVLYCFSLQLQLRKINQQLNKRITKQLRQPIHLGLINNELNKVVANINQCFKAEETLRLERLQEEKRFREMIANISHDLRTPLTAIKGYQQLMEKGELTFEQHEKLVVAQKHADELGTLIEHFFEYSYLLNIDIKPKFERINLTNLMTECIAESIAMLEEKNLLVQYENNKPVYSYIDKEMTIRIIQNLIRNSVFHARGNIGVKITENNDKAVILFKNFVDKEANIDMNRLFERFYTGDKSRSKTTGLGLSIVKLLTEQMGGFVTANLKERELEILVGLPLFQGKN
ncbi:sensor histidine kinase [Clostridium sp. Marseille-P299]|uniref:sensor histidine kinase n=1 Tax=Clostridium sp. Marseille-P299 TaxID=1805477 RepID=UPI00083276BB|nr:HAMP domain-containing sensor histidine kinase [Clostridium sp. Marseille-P299]